MGAIKGWKKGALNNSWKNKSGIFVHAFKVRIGGWVVRIGKTDAQLLKGQKKFQTKILALKFAFRFMRSHPRG